MNPSFHPLLPLPKRERHHCYSTRAVLWISDRLIRPFLFRLWWNNKTTKDEDDGGEIVDHHVEQTLLAITSFEVSGCNHVDFKDEEEASEYSGAAQLVSSDTLPSYAQFVPGLSVENSCDATNTSIAAVEQPTTVLHEKDEDIEAQAPTPLVQSDDVIVAKIRQELLEEEQVVPTSGSSPQQQQSNRANDDKPTPWKRNRCLLMISLVLFLIGISLITGFTMRSNDDDKTLTRIHPSSQTGLQDLARFVPMLPFLPISI